MRTDEFGVTLRLPGALSEFLDAYAKFTGKSKRAILEEKILDKVRDIFSTGRTYFLPVEMTKKELSKLSKTPEEKVKKDTNGKDKVVIFIDRALHQIVCGMAEKTLVKPNEIYKLLIAELYLEHKDEIQKTQEPLPSEELEILKKELGLV